MAGGPTGDLLGQLRRLVAAGTAAEMSDGQLLDRFLTHRDEAAFETLVRRHGPMVLGVCRRLLADPHDADDAFQATFLVLVRKARAIGRRELLGNWLYGVAHRTALKARTRAARRRRREQAMVEEPSVAPDTDEVWRDLRPVLDDELQRLPAKYRAPVVLCYLEGKAYDEAARQLGWPKGTVSTRLTQARELLRARLTRRGVTLSAGTLATVFTQNAASATVPLALATSTVQAATAVVAGKAAAGAVSASVAALTEGVLKAMFMTKVKFVAAVLLAVGILGGGGVATYHVVAKQPSAQVGEEQKANAEKKANAASGEGQLFIRRIVDPEDTLVLVSGRTRIILLHEPPTRIQIGDEIFAKGQLIEPKQLSIMGMNIGTTVLNMWFQDPKDKTNTIIASYLIRVISEDEGDRAMAAEQANAKAGGKRVDSRERSRLLKAKLDAAKMHRDLRIKLFESGAKEAIVTIVLESARNWIEAVKEVGNEAEYLKSLEEHVDLMKRLEEISKKRYEGGQIPLQDHAAVLYHHAEAKLWLLEAKGK